MHVILGALMVVGSFLLAFRFMEDEFQGFFNLYSLVLLIGVPIGLAIATHPFRTIGSALRGLLRATASETSAGSRPTRDALLSLARSLRQGRGAAALEALGRTRDPVFVPLAGQAARRASADDLDRDGAVLSRRDLTPFRDAESLFGSLGEFAPGVGMIGTLIGLVQLLANMGDLASLGPAMAIALLTTFYGLLLAHALYLPLAKLCAAAGSRRAAELELLRAGLRKVALGHPLYEIEELVAPSGQRPESGGALAARGGE